MTSWTNFQNAVPASLAVKFSRKTSLAVSSILLIRAGVEGWFQAWTTVQALLKSSLSTMEIQRQ